MLAKTMEDSCHTEMQEKFSVLFLAEERGMKRRGGVWRKTSQKELRLEGEPVGISVIGSGFRT